ncbi:MAG: sigma-70 family RNA polymerase sigma factor [Pseudomonadota bacterium]
MQDIPDAELLSLIAGGDKTAMRILYDRHQAALYRYIRTRLSDPHEAADALHDAMLDIWRRAASHDGRGEVRGWMFTIARNKAVDRVRRSGRMVPSEPDETTPDDAPNPEQAAIAASDTARVRKCLETLSAAHRTVLHLAFFQELSYPEIAEAEGLALGTVKTRVHHAKRLMAHCLGGPKADE